MITASPRRLSVFKTVVDHGGFNLAAATLGIAQPSVGAHIKALEIQVGQPLFYRTRGTRPQLTKAGEALYAYTLTALKVAEEASHRLFDLRATGARTISLAVHRDLTPRFLSTRIASFADRHPKVRIVTRIGIIEDVLDLVRRNEVNVGIFLTSGAISGLRSHVLAHEPLALVVAQNHPLARRHAVTPADLADFTFITGLRGSRYVRLVQRALARIGVEHIDVAMEVQESQAMKELVRHGTGIACLPRSTVDEDLANHQLTALNLATAIEPLEIRCTYREPADEITKQFIDHLRSASAAKNA
jgi:DNA-binding transcriptional LysR family regulator